MSYGDPTNPSAGRAPAPRPGASGDKQAEPAGASGREAAEPAEAGAAAASSPARPAKAGAPVGRAPVARPASAGARPTGRAAVSAPKQVSIGGVPVGPAAGAAATGPGGDGAGGAGAGGSAAVVGPAGSVATGRAGGKQAAASGSGTATGRASVGRAAVRASAPVVAPGGPGTPGAPAGPGGPGAPPESPGGRRPGGDPKSRAARSRKARRRNLLIGVIAAAVTLAGTTLVGGTYFFDEVAAPTDFGLPESTRIYYADGRTEMAKIGKENRTVIPGEQIPLHVQHAFVAAEDRSFYDNNGVDLKGIVRAAWNNFTGGKRQGASTITQQYAREVADLKGITYSRKLREAIIAVKLNDQLSKDQIMSYYLNTVYFGRGAYGIEAAAQAYFLKPAKDLTVEEGIVLAALVKDPEGSDPGKGSPFDPSRNPESAMARFENIRDAMVDLKLPNSDRAQKARKDMQMPQVAKVDPKSDQFKQQYGLDKPTGLIVHQVMDELTRLQESDQNLRTVKDIKNGGLRIVTTIDKAAQDAAQKYANAANKESPLFGQPDNLQAALVAVEPRTGRVVAYYGGQTGDGWDYAGVYSDKILDDGSPNGTGHPPGSSFKVYTLAAGLSEGVSLTSYWDGSSPKEFPRSNRVRGTAAGPVKNSSGNGNCAGGPNHCRLWEATEQSLNTPFFALTEKVTATKVVEVARAAGVKYIWDGSGKPVDLNSLQSKEFGKYFSTEVGIGQFPITVLDHANGVATMAARGHAAKAHFVREVHKGDKRIYAEQIKPTRIPEFTEQMADDMAWALQKVPKGGSALAGNRPAAGKTGTWQLGANSRLGKTSDNAHAWMVGYTAPDSSKNFNGLAAAVWIGNKKEEQALKLKNGQSIFGATLPGPLWKKFMDEVHKGKPVTRFPEPKYVGDESAGNADAPPPPPDPGQGKPSEPPGGGGNGGGNGGRDQFPLPFPTRRPRG